MKIKLDENWTTNNNNVPLNDEEVARYNAILPNQNQIRLSQKPFYVFIHFGMNTANNREWGNATEAVQDFDIKKINPAQWVSTVKSAGATGLILTCKHHDGFCLWDTGTTDFCVTNSPFKKDIVKMVSDECQKQGIDFGVYLSPWDMHEKTYGEKEYNDFFVRQLTELCTKYGELFEVWFDGAKGANAKSFVYDWERYYKIIRTLQPGANIAICGPDIRWVGNEGGKTRSSEYSVVPSYLAKSETIEKNSQHCESDASSIKLLDSASEDLGSRNVLKSNADLCWYPAEVDVSIRRGWFYHKNENLTVKSAKKLFDIYINSVGNNCTLLLNVPPNDRGVIARRDVRALKKLGKKIDEITAFSVIQQNFGKLTEDNGYLEFRFDNVKSLKYCVLAENIADGQRVEKFDLYLLKPNGKYKRAYKGTVIGSKKIIRLKGKCIGALLIIRQSRSNPVLSQVGFYE